MVVVCLVTSKIQTKVNPKTLNKFKALRFPGSAHTVDRHTCIPHLATLFAVHVAMASRRPRSAGINPYARVPSHWVARPTGASPIGSFPSGGEAAPKTGLSCGVHKKYFPKCRAEWGSQYEGACIYCSDTPCRNEEQALLHAPVRKRGLGCRSCRYPRAFPSRG
jgi:hypothetical protein